MITDWETVWFVQDNRVVVEVEFDNKSEAIEFADKMGDELRDAAND